ncbi:MAG TPA: 30S ribosomal protein S6 [Candidatus Faecisoma merdavium]|nr:30S ribosomal protein S6 [Candidatus Faecisoma merdavium]
MRKYEIMFIARPTLSEEEKKNVIAKFSKILTDNNATITNEKDMGQRELAYEIKDFKSGFYYVITLEANDDKAINEFDRQGRNSSDIIRHLITKIED